MTENRTGNEKQLQQELKKAEIMFNENPVSIVLYDLDLKITNCNPAFISLTGYSRDRLLAMKVKDFTVVRIDGEGSTEARRSRKRVSGKMTVDFPSGRKIISTHTLPLPDETGEIAGFMGVYTDITETEQKAQEIEAYKQKTEIMIEESPCAILVENAKMDILATNKTFCRLTGYPKEKVLRMNVLDFKVIKREGGSASDAFRDKRVVHSSMTIDAPAGIRILDIEYIPILGENRQVDEVFAIMIDLTEIKQKIQEIETFKQKTELMIEENPCAILVYDDKLNFTSTNKAFCRLTGYSREDILRMNIRDIKVTSRNGESARDAIEKRRVTHGRITVENPAGTSILDTYYIPVIDGTGKVYEIYSVMIDLTKEYRVQNYMEHEISEMSTRYEKIANGDLTIRYDLTKPDEQTQEVYNQISKLHLAVRAILNNLRTNIRDVNAGMEELVSTSGEAARNLEVATSTTGAAAVQLGRVSKNTDKVSDNIEQVLKAMEDMSAAIEEVTSNMEAASHLAKETNELSKKGEEKAGKAGESMGRITESSQNVQTIVNDISKQMNEIIKIVGLIRDLANQTNLLALNAAIEAARAGDAGRGFAVVAAEVKSLAQESRNSAENIEEMIAGLRTKSLEATTAMDESAKAVKVGTEVIAETLTSFKEIVTAVEKITHTSEEVASAAGEQAATVEEITASVHEVAQLMTETAKEAGDVMTGAHQVSVMIGDIGKVVDGVNRIAAESLAANKKFKVA
nr:methyl-accepting chemotaxis protein [uncultured Methanoregula sp.]